jgi:hypothetical protein
MKLSNVIIGGRGRVRGGTHKPSKLPFFIITTHLAEFL